MTAALRACGLVLVRLGDGVRRSFGGGRPFAIFQADLVNGRNARIPDFGSIERQSPLPGTQRNRSRGSRGKGRQEVLKG